MREIKFRAWLPNEARIKKGLLSDIHSSYEGQSLNDFIKDSQDIGIILMQYTGLKDKNGKEIYEGDILKYVGSKCLECGHETLYPGHGLYLISWRNWDEKYKSHGAEFVCYEIKKDDPNWMDPDIWPTDMEIVGNIYENPELLKEA